MDNLNKMKKQYQHGDISLHIVDKIPEKAKKQQHNEEFILAYGEISGHIHRLKGNFEVYKDDNGYYIKNLQPIELEHYDVNKKTKAEHNTLTIEKGIWFVRYEERYNPFKKELEKVID